MTFFFQKVLWYSSTSREVGLGRCYYVLKYFVFQNVPNIRKKLHSKWCYVLQLQTIKIKVGPSFNLYKFDTLHFMGLTLPLRGHTQEGEGTKIGTFHILKCLA